MKYIIGGILVLVLLVELSTLLAPSETDLFEAQMRKDPFTWTQTEKNRYGDFMNWLEDN